MDIKNEFEQFSEKALELAEYHKKTHEEISKVLENFNEQSKGTFEALANLGFGENPIVKSIKTIEGKIKKAEKEFDFLSYYKKNYPNNPFFRKKDIITLCKKFNLILGESSKFSGFVPVKNAEDIVNFKIKPEDRRWVNSDNPNEEARPHAYDMLQKKTTAEDERIKKESSWYDGYYIVDKKILVAAPEFMFTLQQYERVVNCEIIEEDIDPLVFYPVKKGYLLITAWGPEKEIIKESNNE